MQDKRVLPGTTDYYVHDEEGRPVYRMEVPSNDSLTSWLTPIMQILRAALGESEQMLVAFARAGAFPEQLMELRDESFEFVTYERPHVPKHAPLKETELKDKLVYHPGNYKTLIDTIRIACANSESELASVLAPVLHRPREAKKVLANIFAASGQVRVNGKSITITLEPSGNRKEQEAIEELWQTVNLLFQTVNLWKLTLPGDPSCRHLRFRSQLS